MASIKLKSNQEVVLRLKACGLTNSEIKKIMEALTPMIEEKADKATTLSDYGIGDAYNKDEVDDKIKQVSLNEVEYNDIDNIIESGVYKLMDGEGTTRQGDGMWLVVSRTSDPIDAVIYVIQYMFSSATSEIRTRTRNPMDGEWYEWKLIGSGAGAVSSVNGQVGNVELRAKDVGAYTKDETDSLKEDMYSNIETMISIELEKKAEKDLSNISDEAFLDKLNAVLPDGDEVSY